MKLIEKKCPNCGATVDFNYGDKNVKCNYCRAKFIVSGYEGNNTVQDINVNSLELQKAGKITSIFVIIFTVLTLIVFIMIGIRFFNHSNDLDDYRSNSLEEYSNRVSDMNKEYSNRVSNMISSQNEEYNNRVSAINEEYGLNKNQ